MLELVSRSCFASLSIFRHCSVVVWHGCSNRLRLPFYPSSKSQETTMETEPTRSMLTVLGPLERLIDLVGAGGGSIRGGGPWQKHQGHVTPADCRAMCLGLCGRHLLCVCHHRRQSSVSRSGLGEHVPHVVGVEWLAPEPSQAEVFALSILHNQFCYRGRNEVLLCSSVERGES